MAFADLSENLAQQIIGTGRRSIVLLFAIGFLAVYAPIAFLTVVLDSYPHVVDTIAVLIVLLLTTLSCAWISWLRVPKYQIPEPKRTRENRGWLLMASGAGLVLVARLIYAVNEIVTGEPEGSIALADGIFGISFGFFVAGLLMFPWSSGESRKRDVLVDAGTVLIVVGTGLWPLLIGPVMGDEFAGVIDFWTVASYLFGISVMTFSGLWVLMRGVRQELLTVALCLAASVGTMVLIQVGYLAFMVSSDSSELRLLFVNAMTSLAFLLLGLASVLRLHVTSFENEEDQTDLASYERPVHRRQIILPYPLIGILLIMRLVMEVFDWRTEYNEGIVIGSVAIVGLLMYRQVQLLRYNDRLYNRVAGIAIRDALTRLYNHRAMQEILRKQAAQAERSGGSLAILFVDVDRFKHYNDTYGHRHGDGILTSIAELLLQECRESDYVGRYGGEEFMVIAPDISSNDACRMGERLRSRIEGTQYVHNGTRSGVTISIGIALFPDDGDSPDAVVERADEAMYRAKATGRNRTVLYQPA